MSLATFSRLVDDIKPFYTTMNGLGEPLLDQTIFEKLDFLHARRIITSMPTNGSLLTGKRFDRLLRSFPDVLTISVDGATQESYESVRPPAKFNRLVENARSLIAARAAGQVRKGQLRILCVLQKANMYDYESMYKLLNTSLSVDSFHLVSVHDYSGADIPDLIPARDEVERLHAELDRKIAGTEEHKAKAFYENWKAISGLLLLHEVRSKPCKNEHACMEPWYSTYIDARGRVYPCCFLMTSQYVMGNVNEMSFGQIWNGERYCTFRKQLSVKRSDMPECNVCKIDHDSIVASVRKWHNLFWA